MQITICYTVLSIFKVGVTLTEMSCGARSPCSDPTPRADMASVINDYTANTI